MSETGKTRSAGQGAKRQALAGVIDMHVHTAPDLAPRKTDDLEMARMAAEAGMGGFVLKSHLGSTVERASLVNQMVPEVLAFGGLVLNYTIGGLNPFAVDAYVRLGAREVWMPTLSAEYTLAYQRQHVPLADRIAFNQAHGGAFTPPSMNIQPGDPWPWSKNGRGISILDGAGKIVPEVWTILEILAPTDVLLGTSHLSVPETHALADAAVKMGVRRLLATHPEYMAPLTIEDQRILAGKGVFFERCLVGTMASSKAVGGFLPFDTIAKNIRAIGVETTVLGTDFGQASNIHPVAAMGEYLERLRQAGFSEDEIESMAIRNPRALLGI